MPPEAQPEVQAQLYWALLAMRSAADADDPAAVENGATEAQVCLDLLLRADVLDRRARSVTLSLWSELCRALGSASWTQVAYCADLLARVVPTPHRRTSHNTPDYVPITDRVRGGVLPRATAVHDIPDATPDADRLLLLIAVALATGAGHLLDFHTGHQPQTIPGRTGWAGARAAGPVLGSYRPGPRPDADVILLRPASTVAAINMLTPRQWTTADADRTLLERWIVEGTLVVTGPSIRRLATQRGPLTDTTADEEEAWVVSTAFYALDQYRTGTTAARSTRHLRSARPGADPRHP